MHPIQKPIIRYLSDYKVSEENYEHFIKSSKEDLTVHDLVLRINKVFQYSPIGFIFQLCDVILTKQSSDIKKSITDHIDQYGNWEDSFSIIVERKKWLRQDGESVKYMRKMEMERREKLQTI